MRCALFEVDAGFPGVFVCLVGDGNFAIKDIFGTGMGNNNYKDLVVERIFFGVPALFNFAIIN